LQKDPSINIFLNYISRHIMNTSLHRSVGDGRFVS